MVLKAQGFVCTSVRTDDGGLDSDDGGRNARNRGLVAKGERFYGKNTSSLVLRLLTPSSLLLCL
jgi:hypothetical protein